MNESFVFYKSFYDSISKLPKENQVEIYDAVCSYSFYGEKPENLSSIAEAIFVLMKPNIDSAQKRYKQNSENGKNGGAPIGNKNAKKKDEKNQNGNDKTAQKQANSQKKTTEKQAEIKQKTTEKQPKNNPETTENNQNENKKQPKNNLDKDKDKDIYKDIDKDNDKETIKEKIKEKKIKKIKLSKSNLHFYKKPKSIKSNKIVYDKLQKSFIECTGSTNINAIKECLSYLDDLPFDVIELALKKTADVNGNWKYAKTILNNWVKKKIDTVAKVEAEDLNFKNARNINKNNFDNTSKNSEMKSEKILNNKNWEDIYDDIVEKLS